MASSSEANFHIKVGGWALDVDAGVGGLTCILVIRRQGLSIECEIDAVHRFPEASAFLRGHEKSAVEIGSFGNGTPVSLERSEETSLGALLVVGNSQGNGVRVGLGASDCLSLASALDSAHAFLADRLWHGA